MKEQLLAEAREAGRLWTEDQAAAGHLMFNPTKRGAADRMAALFDEVADEMAAAALARRDELLADLGKVAREKDAARAAAQANAARDDEEKSESEWQKRQAAASAEKRKPKTSTKEESSHG